MRYAYDFRKKPFGPTVIVMDSDVTPPTIDSLVFVTAKGKTGYFEPSNADLNRAKNAIASNPRLYIQVERASGKAKAD